eukprot:256317_1
MTINNMSFTNNINQSIIKLYIEQKYPNYDYVSFFYNLYENHAIIQNYGNLTITNMNVYGLSFGNRLIHNVFLLNINNFTVIHDNYNPNSLQIFTFIKQSTKYSNTTISNSHFIGSIAAAIRVFSGTITIYDTIFQHAIGAIEVLTATNVMIHNCKFFHIGRYWGRIIAKEYSESHPIIRTVDITENIIIEYNTFFGTYDDQSLYLFIEVQRCYQFILRNNFYILNDTNVYYPIIQNDWKAFGLLYINTVNKIFIYKNNFAENNIAPYIPWISFERNVETCASANNFSNMLFELYNNNITSCFRQELALCIKNNCSDGEYGNINAELFDETSHINIDINTGITKLFTLYTAEEWYPHEYNLYVMDNIQINILNGGEIETEAIWLLEIPNMNILFMDSIFPLNMRIQYQGRIIDNNRLINNETYVAKLKILYDVDYTNVKYLNTSNITYVNHLSASQLYFTSESDTYFPGQKLKFIYFIFDKLKNKINETYFISD